MHVHILGICGTFMGGIALLAKALGHKVSGQDAGVYPPMSDQLTQAGISLHEGYDTKPLLDHEPDVVVIGNALSRGNEAVEYVLNSHLRYTSGPEWLSEHLLHDRWVLAVSGTHGKTTTSSMVAWILEYAKLNPGFLIGGVPENFGVSARLGEVPFFVVEADEYDTAFFDKRSKFVHYHPRTLVINNLEFDHADIFKDLDAIQTQFHHLVRTVPGNGLIIRPTQTPAVDEVIQRGCWTPQETVSVSYTAGWTVSLNNEDGSDFTVLLDGQKQGRVQWELLGLHNVTNALSAIAAARHAGVPVKYCIEALAEFKNVKRRMQLHGVANSISVYDDFAHHPTAIRTTLDGLRKKVGNERIIAVLEPRSNTMKMKVHNETLPDSLDDADQVFFFYPEEEADNFSQVFKGLGKRAQSFSDFDALLASVVDSSKPGDHILVMSNGGFGGIHQKLLDRLAQ